MGRAGVRLCRNLREDLGAVALRRRDKAAFAAQRPHNGRWLLRLIGLPRRQVAYLTSGQVHLKLGALANRIVERLIMHHQERHALVDEVTLVDEGVALGDDHLDAHTLQRPDGHLTRAATAPALARHDDVRPVARLLAKVWPHVVETLVAKLLSGGEMAELAGDNRVGIYPIAKPLYFAAHNRLACAGRALRASRSLLHMRLRLGRVNLVRARRYSPLEDAVQAILIHSRQQWAWIGQPHAKRTCCDGGRAR